MNEKPTQIGIFVTNDFRKVIETLDILCKNLYLDRSRIVRSAIRKEVKVLLKKNKDNPDVAELIKKSTDAQMVFMNFNPHYVKNLN